MQQLVEAGRSVGLTPPPPTLSLETQLEASITTPPVKRVARLALLTLMLSVIPLLGWATLTTMERAVMAVGQLIPEGRRKTINLLEPGILRRLEVREGDIVQQGEPLLQLDVTQAEAAADQAKAAFWSGRAGLARLRTEQGEERVLTFPAELVRVAAADPAVLVFLDVEQQLFRARWSAHDGAVTVQERQITQFQEQLVGARAQREAAQVQLRSARDQIASLNQLLAQGFAARFRVLEMQRTESGYVAAIGLYTAQEAQLREAIAQAKAQLAAIGLNRHSEIATATQTSEAQVATAAQQLRSTRDVLARRVVVSPEAGKVTNIRAFTPGSSIAAGDPIVDLVPIRDRFVVEAQVLPVDIEQVEVGQRVNVRLTSYRIRRLPLLAGRVIQVGADAQTSSTGVSYFTLRAELDLDVLDKLPEVRLTAGMPAEVYVLGETRSPFDYFWAPLRNSARRAFRD